MPKLVEALRRAVGAEPDAVSIPEPIDLHALFTEAIRSFIEAQRLGNQGAMHQRAHSLNALRRLAHQDGHGPALEALWIDPPLSGDAALVEWFAAEMAARLLGGPEAGPRPHQRNEWPFWRERYEAACAALLVACRSGDSHAASAAEDALIVVRNEARAHGQGGMFGHFMPLPPARDEATLASWEAEVAYRIEHGTSSGQFRPPPPLPAFRRASDIAAADHSALVLLAPHGEHPIGARVVLDAAVSHKLAEAGLAVWCEPARVPLDPRPPIEQEPGENGIAEAWVPPPPPPPRVATTFGAA